jgi:hypothetical protein
VLDRKQLRVLQQYGLVNPEITGHIFWQKAVAAALFFEPKWLHRDAIVSFVQNCVSGVDHQTS